MGDSSPFWRLHSVDGKTVPAQVSHTLRIGDPLADGLGQLRDGCTTEQVSVTRDGGAWRFARSGLRTDGVNTVSESCGPAAIDTESEARAVARQYSALEGVAWTAERVDDRVLLSGPGGRQAELRQDQGAIDLRPLFGRPLYLVENAWHDRETIRRRVAELGASQPYIEFGPASVASHDGCNTAGGRYQIIGSRVLFDDVIGTQVGCPVQALMRPPEGVGVYAIYKEPQWSIDPNGDLRVSSVSGSGDTVYSPTP